MKTNEAAAGAKPDPIVAVAILIAGTQIGDVKKGKGAKGVRLPLSQAQALAALQPPAVRIVGV